ncbi:MAG: S4 domain-containing protein, partial [Candidatus Kapaibacterium sp.]
MESVKKRKSNKSMVARKNNSKGISIEKANEPVRINKFLAEAGVASRRKVDELILEGLVKVNGKLVEEPGVKVSATDFITVNGDPIKEIKHNIYILLNKPKNIITTTSDDKDRKTVLDIVKKHDRIFPIGRLRKLKVRFTRLLSDLPFGILMRIMKMNLP